MSDAEAGVRAAEDAQAIIDRLGLGDSDETVVDTESIVAKIEGSGATEVPLGEPNDDKGTQPPGASSSAEAASEGGTQSTSGTQVAGEPAGVLLKDGKHFLPYDKYKESRKEAAEAKARAEAAEAELAKLRAAGETSGESGGTGKAAAAASSTLDEAIAEVEAMEASVAEYEAEGMTAMAAQARSQAKVLRALIEDRRAEAARAKADADAAQRRTAEEVRSAVDEAVDNNPTLRFLRDTDNPLWDAAVDQDAILRQNPATAGLPLEKRLEKVVAAIEAVHGPIKLPPEFQSVASVKAAAQKVVENETAAGFVPRTLSDMPGGGLPSTSTGEALSKMDPVQMARIFDEASPDKLADLLAQVP